MLAKDLSIVRLIEAYAPALTDKQREVLELYYYEDLSLAEIAQDSGISRQGVRDSIKRGETVIQELEDKLHFSKKLAELEDTLERIKQETKEILYYNDKFTYSEQIRRSADSILSMIDRADEE